MSFSNPYVREHLLATRAKVTDPALLVDLWLDQFLETLEHHSDRADQAQTYDLLALFGRLRRCRPDLLQATGRKGSWDRAVAQLEQRLSVWLPWALEFPAPDEWLQEAGSLADACDDGQSDADLAEWAESLLMDLDDADLIAWQARQLGAPAAALEDGLRRCSEWLRDNPDRFFPAGVFVQAVGQTLDPNLAGQDLSLAGTADKFVLILDALEMAQELLPLPATAEPAQTTKLYRADTWADFPEPALTLAAASPQEPGLFRRRWRSPEGTVEALLVVAPPGSGQNLVRITWEEGDQVPSSLVGQNAWLAGCRGTIDAEGYADFSYEELLEARRAGKALTLSVGSEERTWLPVQEG